MRNQLKNYCGNLADMLRGAAIIATLPIQIPELRTDPECWRIAIRFSLRWLNLRNPAASPLRGMGAITRLLSLAEEIQRAQRAAQAAATGAAPAAADAVRPWHLRLTQPDGTPADFIACPAAAPFRSTVNPADVTCQECRESSVYKQKQGGFTPRTGPTQISPARFDKGDSE